MKRSKNLALHLGSTVGKTWVIFYGDYSPMNLLSSVFHIESWSEILSSPVESDISSLVNMVCTTWPTYLEDRSIFSFRPTTYHHKVCSIMLLVNFPKTQFHSSEYLCIHSTSTRKMSLASQIGLGTFHCKSITINVSRPDVLLQVENPREQCHCQFLHQYIPIGRSLGDRSLHPQLDADFPA